MGWARSWSGIFFFFGMLGCGPLLTGDEDVLVEGACAHADDRFAAFVIDYDPRAAGAPAPTNDSYTDPTAALGPPDYDHESQQGAVALGSGGMLEVGFDGCLLGLGGDEAPDLRVYEAGPFSERSFVWVRLTEDVQDLARTFTDVPDDGFLHVGIAGGDVSELDLDGPLFALMGVEAIAFDAVRIIDDPEQGGWGPGESTGADIDAVEILTAGRWLDRE